MPHQLEGRLAKLEAASKTHARVAIIPGFDVDDCLAKERVMRAAGKLHGSSPILVITGVPRE